MNLAFNAVMWGLFTRALTLATSTVRVSVINTSANFMLTALLGAIIFSESLPGLWWLGASFLVAGSVIIGRRDEGEKTGAVAAAASGSEAVVSESVALSEREGFSDEPDAPLGGVGDADGRREDGYRDSVEHEGNAARRRGSGSDDNDE